MTREPVWTGWLVLALAALVLALAASSLTCAPTSQGEDPRRKLVQSWGENVVLPLYRDFEAVTVVLDTRAGELCAGASPASLAAAQDAWWAARAPWKAAEVFAFGPYKDEPLRLGPKIDFWPGRPESVEMILYGTAPITAASIETAGAAAKGLPAIEYLLYEPGADLVGQFSTFPRRCEYLRALTADLVKRATEMREAWDPAHGNYLGEPGIGPARRPACSGHRAAAAYRSSARCPGSRLRSRRVPAARTPSWRQAPGRRSLAG